MAREASWADTVIPIVAIGGTWSWNGSSEGQWYDPNSPWSANMRLRGFEHAHILRAVDRRPYVWSTDINGVWRLFRKPKVNDWQAAGCNLYSYLVPPFAPERCLPAADTHIVCHSHGLQCVIFACAEGLKVNTLISVGSPVRKDMFLALERARDNIGFWWHFHSDHSDRWQWIGGIGDGRFGIVRKHPYADQNVGIPKVGHSKILNDMTLFDQVWGGPIDLIRSRHGRFNEEIADAASTRTIA